MANIHGLFSNRGKRDDENDDDDDDDANNRYVGGIGARGGGRYSTPCVHACTYTYVVRRFLLESQKIFSCCHGIEL